MLLWDYDLPAAGTFYSDKDLTKPIFIGILEMHNNKPRVRILNPYENAFQHGSGYHELYAKLLSPESHNKYKNYTFFNCSQDRLHSERVQILEFEFFASYQDISLKKPEEIDADKTFITTEEKYTKISFEIDNFNNWLWKDGLLDMDKFGVSWKDKDGNKCYNAKDKDGCYCFNENINKLEVPVYTIHTPLNLSDKIKIEIHSTPSPPTYVDYSSTRLPNMRFSVNSRIDIITTEPEKIGFFYWFIYRMCEYFTSIGIGKCKIKRIFDWQYLKASKEFYNKQIPWVIKEDPADHNYWFTRDEMSFSKIKDDLCDSIRLFLDKRKDLHNLIQLITDINDVYKNEYVDTYLSQQIQMLETYGNMKLKGNYNKNEKGSPSPSVTMQDLEKMISEMSDDIFDKIFIHNYPKNDLRGLEVFGYDSKDKPVAELRLLLQQVLMALRNYIIHPYKDGKHKEIQDIPVLKNYCSADKFGLSRNIRPLSSSLSMLLRWLLHKEINLEKHFSI